MEFKEQISVQDFQRLHREVGWKILDDKEIEVSLKNSMFVVAAVENGETIGMARVVGDGATHALLCDVVVSPNHQGKGVGTAIVKEIIKKAQEFANKHDQIIIELLPVAGKEKFYERCGFKQDLKKMAGCYRWFKNEEKYGKK